MNQGKKYSTNSKNIIMKYIKKIEGSFNAQELYKYLKNNNEAVGLTTIYRFLDELEKNGELKKFYDDKNIAIYQYLEKCENINHFYLKCKECEKLIHIDCDCIVELQEHISLNHKFQIENKNIIISGICEKCTGGK